MQIKNKNFISNQMTKRDVIRAFDQKPEVLIEQGFIKRYYQYFKPTNLLFSELIPNEVEIKDVGRINGLNHFSFGNIQQIFECDNYTARVITNLYFSKTPYGFYKRSDRLDQLLADGEVVLKLKERTSEEKNDKDSSTSSSNIS